MLSNYVENEHDGNKTHAAMTLGYALRTIQMHHEESYIKDGVIYAPVKKRTKRND